MTQYRQNIDCLTSDQLHDLREALAALYAYPEASPHSYMTIAGIHGNPSPSYCIHGYPGFLTWHRAYLLQLERALQCIHPQVMVPFWNWSSGPSTGVPAACSSSTYVNRAGSTVTNPLYAGPLPGGGMTSRRSDIDTTTFDDLATDAQSALSAGDFASFQVALNGVHGGVHVRVGGNMSSVSEAGFDPIFYLHHANVDRLWARWQASNSEPLSTDEASLELTPFERPDGSGVQIGEDMFSTVALGYAYRTFCLLITGPWKVAPFALRIPWPIDLGAHIRLVLRSTKMPPRSAVLRVFINDKKAGPRTATAGNPNFAGSVGVFGMAAARGKSRSSSRGTSKKLTMIMRPGERFDLSLDITDALARADRDRTPTVTIVPVDMNGKALQDKTALAFDGIELHHD